MPPAGTVLGAGFCGSASRNFGAALHGFAELRFTSARYSHTRDQLYGPVCDAAIRSFLFGWPFVVPFRVARTMFHPLVDLPFRGTGDLANTGCLHVDNGGS